MAADRRREGSQSGNATLENAAHQLTGCDHIGIDKPIPDFASVALGLDEAGHSENREVLRYVRLARAYLCGQAAYFALTLEQAMQDLEPAGTRERLED